MNSSGTDQRKALFDALGQFPDGAYIEQIESRLERPPTRRTLQRWLSEAIEQGQVRKEGRGRATRYYTVRMVPVEGEIYAGVSITAKAEALLPLSEAGREVERIVHQPTQQRIPVGYNRDFLESYQPNVTFYLPLSVRQDLLAKGQAITTPEPAGTYARKIANRLLIDLSWNSSRLEGNTYSLLETERLLSVGEAVQGKDALEAQMLLNHKEAIEFLIDSAEEIGLNRYTVLNVHALLSDNLLDDPMACGRLRSIPVGIGQTVFIPLDNPHLIDECFVQVLDTAAAIEDPFEQAFFAMVHLPYLQPFEDVNKRVSRLMANIPLIRRNLCPLSFVDVSPQIYISAMLGVYELNRVELLRDVFVWAYKRSCSRYSAVKQSLGEPDPFRLRYRGAISEAVAGVVRGCLGKAEAARFIQRCAGDHIPEPDRDRFIEVVETQLLAVHIGNIARYRLRPSEFEAWQAHWR